MSLAARLVLVVLIVLALCAIVAIVAFRVTVERSLELAIERRLEARLLWIENGIDAIDGALTLRAGSEPSGAAEWWSVTRKDGGTLWRTNGAEPAGPLREETRRIVRRYRSEGREAVSIADIPKDVVLAALRDVPGLEIREASRHVRDRVTMWRLEGEADGLRYRAEVDVSRSGRIVECDVYARRRERVPERVTIGAVPEPVRATIERELESALSVTIELGSDGGRAVWEVRERRASGGEDGGELVELRITEDGTLLAKDLPIETRDLPSSVRETIERVLGSFEIVRAEQKSRGDEMRYEIEARIDGALVHLEIDGDGALLEKDVHLHAEIAHDDLSIADLPQAVRDVLARELGGRDAELARSLREGREIYMAKAEIDGRAVELHVLEDGTILDRTIEIDLDELPLAVRAAAARGFGAGAELFRARTTIAAGVVVYDVVARIGEDELELQFGEDGRRVERRGADLFPRYRLPPGEGTIELELRAVTSAADAESELARISRATWTVGPLALLLAGTLLGLLVRHQLRPLRSMARDAAAIGLGGATTRMGSVGSARECLRLRDALNGMLDRLEEGLERERRFAATAAHELRTPLAQLRSTIEITLRRERSVEEYREALDQAIADVKRLDHLMSGLLELARAPDRARVRGRPVALQAILRAASVDPAKAPDCDGVLVEGDEELLARAFLNVVENARLHALCEPEVSVAATDDRVRVSFADHGPGVPEGDRERIFEPLMRLPRRSSPRDGSIAGEASTYAARAHDEAQGFGLGLSMARATVHAFGGDLHCRAREDGSQGATFVVELRRVRAENG